MVTGDIHREYLEWFDKAGEIIKCAGLAGARSFLHEGIVNPMAEKLLASA